MKLALSVTNSSSRDSEIIVSSNIKPTPLNQFNNFNYMQKFEWSGAVDKFEKLSNVNTSKIKKVLNTCLPREFLLYFHGNPVNNSFAHFFNVPQDKIYNKSSSKKGLSKFAVSLMGFALVLFTFAVLANYSSLVTTVLATKSF